MFYRHYDDVLPLYNSAVTGMYFIFYNVVTVVHTVYQNFNQHQINLQFSCRSFEDDTPQGYSLSPNVFYARWQLQIHINIILLIEVTYPLSVILLCF